ncbi:hypothetical protein L686_04460 [Stutzerimonas stutzeri MF28]|nr:hypothetical protein L686_04460 [Stutzerimonas stutzeri MF28]
MATVESRRDRILERGGAIVPAGAHLPPWGEIHVADFVVELLRGNAELLSSPQPVERGSDTLR